MKRLFILFVAVVTAVSVFSQDDCPWFNGGYPSMTYNLNTDPWEFDLQIFGDTVGANIKWYTYDSRGGQTIKDTVLYTGPGSNTVSQCFPATDISMRNTYLDYVCVVKTPGCPNGAVSPIFDVQVATGGDCGTNSGSSLTLNNVKTYTEGNKVTLTATFNAYGGHHHYIWYHNGVPVGEPEYQVVELAPQGYVIPANGRSIVDYKDDFNTSYLTIPACEVDDQGAWQVRVWDGIDSNGDTCSVWSTTKNMNIIPVTQCPIFNWRIDGEEGLSKPMYPGETHAVSVYTTEPNPTEETMPSPASLTIEAEGITILDTVATGDTLTVRFSISETAVPGTAIHMTALTKAAGIHYRQCTDEKASAIAELDKTYLVFDDNNGTHVWSDAKNWWPTYDRIPHATDSAVIRSACQVDIHNAVVGDLTFEVADSTDLTILPTGALTVVGMLTNVAEGDMLIQSSAAGNGALVLSEGNTAVPAKVQFYAKSKEMSTSAPVWQYMGYPMQDSPLIKDIYPLAAMYEWTNIPNAELGGNWARVDSLTGMVSPFVGYCMTEETETTYTMSGILNDPVAKDLAIPNNNQGEYPDFAFVANSWVAPIDIERMEESDFGEADATVYIMNTGTYAEAKTQQSSIKTDGTATARGQYNAIPVHAAAYIDGSLKFIPPMQGFFVHATQATTLTLDYQKAVFATTDHAVSTEATRVGARRAGTEVTPVVYRLDVRGFGAEDNVYLLQDNRFTIGFDNGWDGYQFKSDRSAVHLSVVAEDNRLSVAALPAVTGTQIAFEGQQDKYYTITIHCDDTKAEQGLYLWDSVKDVYTPMIDGAQYLFDCTPQVNRFQIVCPEQVSNSATQVEKFIRGGILYIRKGNTIYNCLP